MGVPLSRQFWVVAHRWAGLTIAFFLCVAGLTGSVIVWNHELEALTAPRFMVAVPPAPDAKPLDPLTLRARAEALSGAQVDSVALHGAPGETARFYPVPRAGQPSLSYSEIALDPYSGAEQGRRWRGDLGEGWHNLIPFVYRLHYQLALGHWMEMAFGIAALIWVVDCFVGFYLTLPRARPGWLRRWRKSWSVRLPVANRYRLNVDLHTAGGLWLWPVLLVFAWSGVGFNLRQQVYNPVMVALTGRADIFSTIPRPAVPNAVQRLDWEQARTRGREIAAGLAAQKGFRVEREGYLMFQRAAGLWRYQVRTDRDIDSDHESTRILFRDSDGGLFSYQIPSGDNTRDTIDSWTFGLHMAFVWGLPYRIFVTLLGLMVTTLSVTGVIIWMRKRGARLVHRRRPRRVSLRVAGLVPAE